ncbi:hypothetical protein [Salegentibacter chungangensis]|uniref:MORN repeat variant n=1 Tax=Salegentibacter chungangensis TaxID=1335724 RepID=A0ABW3NST3_9FLAO
MRILLKLLILIILISCKSTKTTEKEEEKVQIKYESGELKLEGSYSNEYLPIYKLRIGEWKEFYKNGNLKSIGNYKIGQYEECCTGGVCDGFYNYKIGQWTYFYENGKTKAEGKFDTEKFQLNTYCEGGEKISFGVINPEKWNFYDKMGNKMKPSQKDIQEIEQTKTNGAFPESTFSVDKGTKNIIWEQ